MRFWSQLTDQYCNPQMHEKIKGQFIKLQLSVATGVIFLVWTSFCGWGGDASWVTSFATFLSVLCLGAAQILPLPLQQMLPAEGSCQLIEAAAAAAGLSSKTRSGHLIMLLVHSSPLNCAAVIKWEKWVVRTEFYIALFSFEQILKILLRISVRSHFYSERNLKLLSELLDLFEIKCCRAKKDSSDPFLPS